MKCAGERGQSTDKMDFSWITRLSINDLAIIMEGLQNLYAGVRFSPAPPTFSLCITDLQSPLSSCGRAINRTRWGRQPDANHLWRHSGGHVLAGLNETFKNSEGDKKSNVLWVRCVAWRRWAEIAGEHVTKGNFFTLKGGSGCGVTRIVRVRSAM